MSEKEFLKTFFSNFELFERDLDAEAFSSKFYIKVNHLNEIFARNIKISNNDMERLIYVFHYMDVFFNTFTTHLKLLGFNVSNLEKSQLKVLEPLRLLKINNIIKIEKDDTVQQIINNNHLHNYVGKIDKDIFAVSDLEFIFDFFEFTNTSIKYFEAFSKGDMELKKVIEKTLTSQILIIIKKQ